MFWESQAVGEAWGVCVLMLELRDDQRRNGASSLTPTALQRPGHKLALSFPFGLSERSVDQTIGKESARPNVGEELELNVGAVENLSLGTNARASPHVASQR